ncbi:MAG: hypothetical protein HQL73_02255 [Magnetococcales bacterium]|nr:hypothetical protein [Magnetococcales bacterium]
MTPQRRQEINQKAEEILHQFSSCTEGGVVDVEAIIAQLGGTINRLPAAPLEDEAVIHKQGQSFRIDLREAIPKCGNVSPWPMNGDIFFYI